MATWRTAANFILYGKFAVHNILQYYFGTREGDILPGSIPSDTLTGHQCHDRTQVLCTAPLNNQGFHSSQYMYPRFLTVFDVFKDSGSV
jgi:hypothetical protein